MAKELIHYDNNDQYANYIDNGDVLPLADLDMGQIKELEAQRRRAMRQVGLVRAVDVLARVGQSARSHAKPRRSKPGAVHGPQYGDEEGVGYPDGKPPYYQPYDPLSTEQYELNDHWKAVAAQNLGHRTPTDDEAVADFENETK